MIYLKLFWTFLQIGAFSFGGGYGMISLIRERALALGWLSEEELLNMIAVAESTPGPIAVNMATFVGAEMGGVLGAACATLGVVLPCFVVILLVARCYKAFCASKWVKGLMRGLKPAVVGLIGSTLVTVALAVFFPGGAWLGGSGWFWLAVLVGMFLFSQKYKKLHPIVIICICALLGILAGYLGL